MERKCETSDSWKEFYFFYCSVRCSHNFPSKKRTKKVLKAKACMFIDLLLNSDWLAIVCKVWLAVSILNDMLRYIAHSFTLILCLEIYTLFWHFFYHAELQIHSFRNLQFIKHYLRNEINKSKKEIMDFKMVLSCSAFLIGLKDVLGYNGWETDGLLLWCTSDVYPEFFCNKKICLWYSFIATRLLSAMPVQ